MKHYIIIGGGVASIGCVEGIRSVDSDCDITIISGEAYPVYCRPLISYYLQGKTDFQRMKYRSDDFYIKNNCNFISGHKATAIDTKNKKVILDNNSEHKYDGICIATGSSPFVPPFKGLDTVENKYTFMTIEDTKALEQAVNKDSKVLIIGAGLIGLKCAEGLSERVAEITVCDLADRVLSSILDATCAKRMQAQMEGRGVKFMLGNSVEAFEGNVATMNDKSKIPFDVLVLAVGVRPNTSLAAEIGAEVNRGIVIDTKMQTSVSDIYSAGDCTEGYDSSADMKRILAIMPNAYMQGRTAGINMAGGDESFDNAIPMNAIGFFGLHALTAGSYTGEMYEEADDESIKRLFIEDGVLKGFMMIGNVNNAGIYTSLIREKTPLDTLDVDSLKKIPCLSVFSDKIRRKKLGGVV